jgi:gamma-glutamyl-gamma-aminobutyrate hydrolase PuuD
MSDREAGRVTVPRIGITRSGSAERIGRSYQPYHERIREAGAEPVDLFPGLGADPVLLDGLDGLLLTGGADAVPARYGQEPHPETDGGDAARDEQELALIRAALARDLPIFAICRGQQVLNVALGGTLLQHIEGDSHRAHERGAGDSRWHTIQAEPGSRLADLLGTAPLEANSRHHQAVAPDGVAGGLVVTARAPDGIIEGLELPGRRWVLAVQWHPERDEVAERFRSLFAAFVAEAAHRPTPAGREG